jgi:hypothetical protein
VGAAEQRERTAAEHIGGVKPMLERGEFEAMRSAMPDLNRLERYRQRAWSRRWRAIRRFMEIQSGSKSGRRREYHKLPSIKNLEARGLSRPNGAW